MANTIDPDLQTRGDSQGLPSDPLVRFLGGLAAVSIAIGTVGTLFAWMGGAGIAEIAACTVGMLAGLWLCNPLEWTSGLGSWATETAKCVALAACSVVLLYVVGTYLPGSHWSLLPRHVGAAGGGFYNALPGPMYSLVLVVQVVLIKLTWLDLEIAGVLLTTFFADAATIAAMALASQF